MWNVEEGLNQIDKFFHDGDDFVKSGACLGAFFLLAFILFYFISSALSHSDVVQIYVFFRACRCLLSDALHNSQSQRTYLSFSTYIPHTFFHLSVITTTNTNTNRRGHNIQWRTQ